MDKRDSRFEMAAADKPGALAAIHALMGKVDELGEGGRWSDGKCVEKWFSWVDTGVVLKATELSEAMQGWGWPIDEDETTGDVTDIYFYGEKAGQEELLFKAIAPFVKDGSYIEMVGEDGSIWRWLFKGGKCVEQNATVSYGDDE